MATGLATGPPGAAAWFFAGSALAWFLLYEPVAMLLGLRGERRRAAAGRVWPHAAGLALTGTLLGVVALVLSPPAARVATVVPVGLALLMIPVVWRGKQKTLGAELLVVAALCAVLLPVAAAAGAQPRVAWTAFGVWLVSFALITLAVHGVKARHRRVSGQRWTVWAAPLLAGITVAVGIALAATGVVPRTVGLSLLPAALCVLGVALLRVHPRRLRVVGWSVVGSNALTLGLLLL